MTYKLAKLTKAISLIQLGAKILNQIDTEREWGVTHRKLQEVLEVMLEVIEYLSELEGKE